MAAEEKLDELRIEAGEILAMNNDDEAELFHREIRQRKLGRLVRRLDRLARNGGSDLRIAAAALERLGFPALTS